MSYDLSILIPTYKRPTEFNYLITTLLSNFHWSLNYEIVVLDNDPVGDYTHRCIDLLNKYTDLDTDRVSIYEGRPDRTEIWFRPELMSLARGKYHWFIDDDCIIDTQGLSNIVDIKCPIEFSRNQLFYEDKIYTQVYDMNLYDIIYDSIDLDVNSFKEKYTDYTSFRVGGDKELLRFILSSNRNNHREIWDENVIVNLYRRGGDNLMLN